MITVKNVSYGGFKADVQIDEAVYNKIKVDCVKDTLEKISNTIEAMIYKKTDEYGADIPEMYAEIVDDLQEFIVQELKDGE